MSKITTKMKRHVRHELKEEGQPYGSVKKV